MSIKTKLLMVLVGLAVVDIVIPVPIIGIILVYVLLQKPSWFIEIAHRVYGI